MSEVKRRSRLLRTAVSAATAFIVATGSALSATPAMAAPVYDIKASWADGTPTQVASGDVINSEWRINVNDDAAAPSNEPVPNVTFTVTATNGTISRLPDACLTTDVTPASTISADGVTLTCNVGPVEMGTAVAVQVPILADGTTGDRVSLVGDVHGVQAAPLPEIPINNPFGMDIVWQSPTNGIGWADDHVDIDVQWTLFTQKGSDPGPDTVSYRLDVTNPVGAAVQVGPQACSAFTTGGATGHPWSGGTHPAEQTAPFVDSCSLTRNADGSFTMTLTGIDYSRLQVPTRDSVGRALPTDREAVASGTVWFRFMSGANNSMTLTSSAPTYQSPSGATSTDDPSNNTSSKTWTRGGWSNAWQAEFNGIQVPSWWSNEFRISAGQTVQSTTTANWAASNPAAMFGQCQILDTRYVDFVSAEISQGWGGSPLPGVALEYYVGDAAIVDPASTSYDPNAFRCDQDAAGWTTAPAEGQAVKAVRALYPFSAMTGNPRSSLNVRHMIKPDAPVGTDVWEWGAAYANGAWQYPSRSMNEADRTGPATPDARYPFIGSGRDVLYVISATPFVEKVADRSSVKPGEPANFTLRYSANGAGAIPPTVDGYELVDTLPVGMSYVAGSAAPAPQVSTTASGQQVLTWTLNGVATNVMHTLTYQAVAGADVVPGSILTNTVAASYGGQTRSASESVTVSTNGYTQIGKTTDQWFIANPDGDGSGETGSWTVTIRSVDPLPSAFTDTIDILPFNGDGRGTDFSGTYALTSVQAPAGSTVYYTDADPSTLSDDPNAPANGTAGSPSAMWTTTQPANPTAIRVVGGELAPGEARSFVVTIQPDGAEPGDVYVNRAQAIAEHTELVMRTSEPLTMGSMYSVSLKKYVQDIDGNWVDANDAVEYPTYRVGETVPYRVVVTNTGQGTLRDLVITDDQQPELGGFTIDELEPGEENAHVHEYDVVLEAGGPDTLINWACVNAPQPADTEEQVQESCDPAGIEVTGEPTHSKTLVSATPIGNGQWELLYDIEVTNESGHPTSYDLDDTLRFTDEATIVTAEVTDSPDGVQLAEPAWDGVDAVRIATNAALLGADDDGYAPHQYQVRVIADAPLQFEGAGTDTDPTACGAEGDGTARAFTNTTTLTDARGDTEDDWACAALPSIDIAKSVSAGPTANGDGTWTVTYDVVATNDGTAEGVYDLSDRMTAEGDLEVVSGSVTDAPDEVTPLPTWTGMGAEGAAENVIATEVPLAAGASHTYVVEVVIGLVEGTEGAPVITECSAVPGEGGGLSNTAEIEHNDLTDDAAACITVGLVTVDKSVSSGPTPNGDGTWTVVYDIVATHVGAADADYDVTDRLHFGEGVEIVAHEVRSLDGIDVNADWTGLGAEDADAANLVASDVTLEVGGSHTYQVEVTVEMDESSIDPSVLACAPGGSGEEGGLGNSTTLTSNGITAQDDVCPTLPLIELDKELVEGNPVSNGDGTWTIRYDVSATNVGEAAGDYDLSDRLRYGAGLEVESSQIVDGPDGVEANAAWTGQGAAGAAENVIVEGESLEAGQTHTFRVEVVAAMDREVATPATLTCPAPGSGEPGGFANTAGLVHNGEPQTDEACAEPPLIDIAKSLSGAVVPVEGEEGVYDATYEITVTNSGPGAGVYDLDDELAPGEGVSVVGIEDVTTDAPGAVARNEGFDGLEDVRIVTGQPIAGAAAEPVVHTYTVTVRYATELAAVTLPEGDACTDDAGAPLPGTLNNTATVVWNGLEGSDDECLRPGKPTLDKELVTATPIGDGRWEVVYDLTVGNIGGEATTYDLDDELLFAQQISAESVAVTGPEGVELNDAFDGEGDQRIATDVEIAGLDDEGYEPHVYRVTVIAAVPLHFESDAVGEDGTASPACTAPAGGNLVEQGFNNAATLTDEAGGTIVDTDCAPVPSMAIVKAMDGEPVQGDDGRWTVGYAITVTNDGAASGLYSLTDELRYGTGIEVTSATVTEAPEGVTPAASWTGLGETGSVENQVVTDVALEAGATHTYRVVVEAVLDTDAADATTISCPAEGSADRGGFANTAGLTHNDLAAAAAACALPEWPEEVPPPTLPDTGASIGVGVGVLALLLMAAGALLVARRRSEAATQE